jgi:nitrogen regulatory protein PII
MFQVACDDGETSSIIEAVRNAAGTGKIGDGKIFITELTDVVRIRTGETGSKAI